MSGALGRKAVKVGFFDSGIGGRCILDAFRRLCPTVETEYLADSAHCPYGNRAPEDIVRLSVANTEELLRRGCGVVVVACNTATAAAIDQLRARYPAIPFVGVEPLLKAGADRIVLGCTHFPHLKPIIEQVCAGRAEVVDSSEAVARQIRRVLSQGRDTALRPPAPASGTRPYHSDCITRVWYAEQNSAELNE